MRAEHRAQCPMQKMRRGVIAARAVAACAVYAELELFANAQRAGFDAAAVRDEPGERLVAVFDDDLGGAGLNHAVVTDLTAGFAVKRRLIADQLDQVARVGFFDERAVFHDSEQRALVAVLLVAGETHRAAWDGGQGLAIHALYGVILRLELGTLARFLERELVACL